MKVNVSRHGVLKKSGFVLGTIAAFFLTGIVCPVGKTLSKRWHQKPKRP